MRMLSHWEQGPLCTAAMMDPKSLEAEGCELGIPLMKSGKVHGNGCPMLLPATSTGIPHPLLPVFLKKIL